MAKYFKYFYIIILMLTGSMLSSCDNSDDIGDLLGMWKLDEVTFHGETTRPNDLFFCFQSQYVDARQSGGQDAIGHYTTANGIMKMTFYYVSGDYSGSTTDPNNPGWFLKLFNIYDDDTPQTEENIRLGINPVDISFKVETLSSSKMVLSNDDGRWCFTKY